jgi:hypothetical protein
MQASDVCELLQSRSYELSNEDLVKLEQHSAQDEEDVDDDERGTPLKSICFRQNRLNVSREWK